MNKKRIIRKVMILTAWFLVISGIATLLIAANRKQTEHTCKKVLISIRGTGEKFYIEEGDVIRELEAVAKGSLIGKPVAQLPLAVLEKGLESNKWIRDAELYFDRENRLHVSVDEREPIARIFTTAGASFYMDSSGHQMPLLEKVSARVPVITGFRAVRSRNGKDSAFLDEVKKLAWFVYTDSFWNAQIGQIDITKDNKFELIPVIGDHLIRLGNTDKLDEKLHRLLLFYQKVLSKVGFNRYSVVDVQFDGQVIGVNKGETSRVDSLQLQKNIEELLKRSTIQNISEEMLPGQNTVYIPRKDSTVSMTAAQNNSVAMKTTPDPITSNRTNTSTAKRTNPSKPNEKPVKVVKKTARPKAVMKKKN